MRLKSQFLNCNMTVTITNKHSWDFNKTFRPNSFQIKGKS